MKCRYLLYTEQNCCLITVITALYAYGDKLNVLGGKMYFFFWLNRLLRIGLLGLRLPTWTFLENFTNTTADVVSYCRMKQMLKYVIDTLILYLLLCFSYSHKGKFSFHSCMEWNVSDFSQYQQNMTVLYLFYSFNNIHEQKCCINIYITQCFIFQEHHVSFTKSDGLKRGFPGTESSDYQIVEAISGDPLILLYSLNHFMRMIGYRLE